MEGQIKTTLLTLTRVIRLRKGCHLQPKVLELEAPLEQLTDMLQLISLHWALCNRVIRLEVDALARQKQDTVKLHHRQDLFNLELPGSIGRWEQCHFVKRLYSGLVEDRA